MTMTGLAQIRMRTDDMKKDDDIKDKDPHDRRIDADTAKLCPACKKAPKHVTKSGLVTAYCKSCRNIISRDRYRKDPLLREYSRDRARIKYKNDVKFRDKKKRKSREYVKANDYLKTDRFRISAVKTHMTRMTDAGLETLVGMVFDEALARAERYELDIAHAEALKIDADRDKTKRLSKGRSGLRKLE